MEGRFELLTDTLNKCNIYLENDLISNEFVIKTAVEFLDDTLAERKHNSAMLLHTGSICFDAVAFVICILANLIFDENDAVEEAATIEIGSTVSYRKKLWKYEGLYAGDEEVYKGKYILRGDEKNGTMYLSESGLGEVLPYNGNAKKLSGKGIKVSKSKRIEFQREVLGLKGKEIVATSRMTTVLFMDNSELDYLLENIVIEFEETKKQYCVLDLATVTYYTGTQEFRKRGNASNNEPAIKVTNSMERARELVVSGEESEVLGFASFRNESYQKNALDLEELLKRRKLRFAWLIAKQEYNHWIEAQAEDDNETMSFLSLTASALKGVSSSLIEDNDICKALSKEILRAEQRKYHGEVVESCVLWKDYKRIKNHILFLMNHCLDDGKVIQFSRWAYASLKFFNNAFFTMCEFEKTQEECNLDTFRHDIELERGNIVFFAELLKDKAREIVDYIEKLYLENEYENPKRNRIKQYIFEQNYKKVLFVVPNARYEGIFKTYASENMRYTNFDYVVRPETKIKQMDLSLFDCVAFVSLMNFDKVNPVDLISAKETVVFLYDSQLRLYKKIVRDYQAYIGILDSRNPEWLRTDELIEEQDLLNDMQIDDVEYIEEVKSDSELQDAFMRVFLQSEQYQSREYFGKNYQYEGGADAYGYGKFVSGEQIIFTKNYEAYVLDSVEGTVIEKKVDELETGDKLVFTCNDDKTKDIVDELLIELCDRSDDVNKSYKLVKGWKEEFREVKKENMWSYVDIANRFVRTGCPITPQTIRQWLDEESHIVGPKEKERFKFIGKVMGDTEIEQDYVKYYEATSMIRSIRIKILKLIENAVVADLNGIQYDEDGMFKDTIGRIRDIAVIKQLEHIELIEPFKIQINRANRPIDG